MLQSEDIHVNGYTLRLSDTHDTDNIVSKFQMALELSHLPIDPSKLSIIEFSTDDDLVGIYEHEDETISMCLAIDISYVEWAIYLSGEPIEEVLRRINYDEKSGWSALSCLLLHKFWPEGQQVVEYLNSVRRNIQLIFKSKFSRGHNYNVDLNFNNVELPKNPKKALMAMLKLERVLEKIDSPRKTFGSTRRILFSNGYYNSMFLDNITSAGFCIILPINSKTNEWEKIFSSNVVINSYDCLMHRRVAHKNVSNEIVAIIGGGCVDYRHPEIAEKILRLEHDDLHSSDCIDYFESSPYFRQNKRSYNHNYYLNQLHRAYFDEDYLGCLIGHETLVAGIIAKDLDFVSILPVNTVLPYQQFPLFFLREIKSTFCSL